MAIPNIFQNPAIARYADYTTDLNITDVPFVGDVNIPFEGRTKPVTDISEIAPTGSTQNVLAKGIANATLRNKFDFTQPFSTLVKGSGQPNIRDPSQTYDYSGYKLGNPTPGVTGMGKEVWETLKTVYGGDAANIIANTLGDYTARYTPKLDPNHPEVMNIYDRYDFKGKGGEGHGSPYDIDVNLPSDLLAQIKNYYQDEDEKETITFNPNDPKVKQAGLPLKKLWDIYRAYKVGKKIKKHGPQVLGTLTGILKGQDTKAEVPSKKIVTPPRGGGADVMPIPPSRKTYVSPARPHAGYEQSGGSAQQDRGPPGGDPGWKGARGGYVDRPLPGRSRYL